MPTVSDALLVTLGLDSSNYTKNTAAFRQDLKKTKDETSKISKEIAEDGARAAEYFTSLKREVLGLAAALIGFKGLDTFATDTVRSGVALGNMAKTLRMSAQDVAVWEESLSRIGGTAEDATGALGRVSKAWEGYLTGHPDAEFMNKARLFGVTDDQLSDPQVVLRQLAKGGERMEPAYRQGQLSDMDFSPKTINFLGQGLAAVDAQLAKSRALGVPTNEEIQSYRDLTAALHDMGQAAKTAGRDIMDPLVPALDGVIDRITHKLEDVDKGKAEREKAFKRATDQSGGNEVIGAVKLFWWSFRQGLSDVNSDIKPNSSYDRSGASPPTDGAAPGDNPGNIRPVGGTGFRQYSSDEDGLEGIVKNLQAYKKKGWTTLSLIASHWAPKGDGANDPIAYAANLANRTGFGTDQQIDLSDPATLLKLVPGIITQEQGHDRYGAAREIVAIMHALGRPSLGAAGGGSTSSVENNVNVTVNAPSGDANAISNTLQKTLQRNLYVGNVNSGAF